MRRYPLSAVTLGVCAVGLTGCASLGASEPEVDVRPVLSEAQPTPASQDVYYLSAVNLIEGRNYAAALRALQIARSHHPNEARILNAFGIVYDKLGRFDLSARYYAQAQAADPQSSIVASNMAYSRWLQAQAEAPAPVEVAEALATEPTPAVVVIQPVRPAPEAVAVASAPVAVAEAVEPEPLPAIKGRILAYTSAPKTPRAEPALLRALGRFYRATFGSLTATSASKNDAHRMART